MELELVSVDRYLEAPVGRAFGTDHLAVWYVDPSLRCVVVWGLPAVRDVTPEGSSLISSGLAFQSLSDARGTP